MPGNGPAADEIKRSAVTVCSEEMPNEPPPERVEGLQ